jgi:plastocyanin
MKTSAVFLLVVALTAVSAGQAADITGGITFKGTPPAEADIGPKMTEASPDCAAMYDPAKMPTTHFYVVGAKGEFADVVVSLKNVTGKSTGSSAPPAVLDQKGCVYVPTILAVQTGQKIIVKNSDACVHNVHCKPTVDGNQEFNNVQMPGGADLTYSFPKPEPFLKFQCDVHPWMFAWVTVVDSPYFCVSDKGGKFVIKNVPPGKYTVEAAHRKLGSQTQEVEIKDTDATVNFTFEVK